jgi:hypothetical protein
MPPDTERLEQIMTMRAQHDHQLRHVVRIRGSHDPEVVDDACGHAWSRLLAAEHVDLRPPRWGALAWLTTCAVHHARLLHARNRSHRHRSAEREGFEPSVDVEAHTRFPVVPVQPLRHLSSAGRVAALSVRTSDAPDARAQHRHPLAGRVHAGDVDLR